MGQPAQKGDKNQNPESKNRERQVSHLIPLVDDLICIARRTLPALQQQYFPHEKDAGFGFTDRQASREVARNKPETRRRIPGEWWFSGTKGTAHWAPIFDFDIGSSGVSACAALATSSSA
jgi:hypothetical protein